MKYNGTKNSNNQQQARVNSHKSEFDTVEESLRDALRHGGRPATVAPAKEDTPTQMQSRENTRSKQHDYITVFEHHQPQPNHKGRDLPNSYENIRMQSPNRSSQQNGVVPLPVREPPNRVQNDLTNDDFRRYCTFLAERMQKMEEQNVQLVRLAEQQKQEYNKVTAQIVHSEMMQRRLHRECSNLRRQVQQLTHYNRQLIDTVPHHSNHHFVNPDSQLDNPLHGRHRDQSPADMPDLSPASVQDLRSGAGLTNGLNKSVMARLLESSLERDANHDVIPEDIETVVKLYTALREASSPSNQKKQEYDERGLSGPVSGAHHDPNQVLDVIHEQPETGGSLKSGHDYSDYASPSNVCARPSCTTCAPGSEVAGSKPTDSKSARSSKLTKIGNGRPVDQRQSFDNNSYVEVELKCYDDKNAARADSGKIPDVGHAAFRRDGRLRRSHNNYMNVTPKAPEPQRPSSLVLDLESVQVAMHQFADKDNRRNAPEQRAPLSPSRRDAAPLSPAYSEPTQRGNSSGKHHNKQSAMDERRDVTQQKPPMSPSSSRSGRSSLEGKVWMARSDQARYASADSGHVTSPGSPGSAGGSRKLYSRSDLGEDLPPPPPPPPLTDDEDESTKTKSRVPNPSDGEYLECAKARSGLGHLIANDCDDDDDGADVHGKTRTKEGSSFQDRHGKLSVWKQNRAERDPRAGKTSESGQKDSGWRRKSYAAACRKSQSLDQLYDQMLVENGRDKHSQQLKVDKAGDGAATFSTLQHNRKTQTSVTSSLRTTPGGEGFVETEFAQARDSVSSENVFDEEFPPPPPPHMLQEVMSQERPSTGYAVMNPINGNENNARQRESQRKHRTHSEGKVASPKLQKSPDRLRKQLQISASKSETSLLIQTTLSAFVPTDKPRAQQVSSPDFEVENTSTSPIDVHVTDDDASMRLRHRRMSEGSFGRRHKDHVELSGEEGKNHIRRRRSMSTDLTSNKKREAASRSESSSLLLADKQQSKVGAAWSASSNFAQQPRFPSTNPYIRSARTGSFSSNPNIQYSPASSPETTRATRGSSLSGSVVSKSSLAGDSPSGLKAAKSSASRQSKSPIALQPKSQNSKNQERGRSVSKSETSGKKGKDGNGSGGKKRTSGSGGSQSRSLVDIMKSKFGRSVSGGRSSSAGKKSSPETKAQVTPSEQQLKPASSFIDPRTLSLEPNSYLPPGKDGFTAGSKKASKLKLGNISDNAVGRKLSQPYPNGTSSISAESNLTKVIEEVVSDEGFAEGSTIERQEKENSPEPKRTEPDPRQGAHEVTSWSARGTSVATSKKSNTDWYENVTTVDKPQAEQQMQTEHPKRFHIVSCDDASEHHLESGFPAQDSVKQKHTRSKAANESAYENFPLESRLRHAQPSPVSFEPSNDLFKRLSMSNDVYQSQLPPGRDVFATGVTIIRTPPNRNQSPTSLAIPQSRLARPQQKSPKPASGIGKIIKSVSSHYSGSNSDVSTLVDNTSSHTNQKPRKAEKEISSRKINYAAHQKVFEKAFISSVVESQLGHRHGGRNSPRDSTNTTNSAAPSPSQQLSMSSSCADNIIGVSVGTGSSFGSLPSDGLGDVIGFQGTSSSESSSPGSKPVQQRLPKSKRDAASALNKTGTTGSTASTSSSEISFRGRSKKSGLRSPTVPSTPAAPSHGHVQSPSISASRAEEQRSPEYQQSFSRPPPYPETQPRDKSILENVKATQNRRSQSGSRVSRISGPSKLSSSGRSENKKIRSLSASSQEGSPSSNLPRSPKVKLAPLNYGFSGLGDGRKNGAKSPREGQEPIYENVSIINQHHSQTKQSSHPGSQIPSKIATSRIPPSSSARGAPSPRSLGCSQTQMEPRKIKRTIPLAVGLHRPRPINPSVGVV